MVQTWLVMLLFVIPNRWSRSLPQRLMKSLTKDITSHCTSWPKRCLPQKALQIILNSLNSPPQSSLLQSWMSRRQENSSRNTRLATSRSRMPWFQQTCRLMLWKSSEEDFDTLGPQRKTTTEFTLPTPLARSPVITYCRNCNVCYDKFFWSLLSLVCVLGKKLLVLHDFFIFYF